MARRRRHHVRLAAVALRGAPSAVPRRHASAAAVAPSRRLARGPSRCDGAGPARGGRRDGPWRRGRPGRPAAGDRDRHHRGSALASARSRGLPDRGPPGIEHGPGPIRADRIPDRRDLRPVRARGSTTDGRGARRWRRCRRVHPQPPKRGPLRRRSWTRGASSARTGTASPARRTSSTSCSRTTTGSASGPASSSTPNPATASPTRATPR